MGSIVESLHMLKCCKLSVLAFHMELSPQSACKKTPAERALSLTQTASHGNHTSPTLFADCHPLERPKET